MLTPARHLVMLCLMNGLTARQTAVLLQKSDSTVRKQREEIRQELGARTAPHAAVLYLKRLEVVT
jgi:DNA-binding CsgD family transcriptional regulator